MDLWKELLRQAYVAAAKSTDPSTQNGALVVGPKKYWKPGLDPVSGDPVSVLVSDGLEVLGSDCNRFPKGVIDTPERWNDRNLKYKLVHHAERTTLDTARRTHKLPHLDGYTLVCPWAACTDCAKEMIAAGISTLVIHKQAHDLTPPGSVWLEDIIIAHQMLREASLEIIIYDGKVDGPPIRHSGKYWNP